jgi:hypothetical protein
MLIEVTTFRLNDGVSSAQLLTADRAVQAELSPREGFVRRTTASDDAGRWLVITMWGSSEDADRSADLAFADPAARSFDELSHPSSRESHRFLSLS